jgi:hypothetical protein
MAEQPPTYLRRSDSRRMQDIRGAGRIRNGRSGCSQLTDGWGGKYGTSPLNISGQRGDSFNLGGLTFIMNAGTPEGNQQGKSGSFYQDTDTGIVYVKTDGDDTLGWTAIT